MTLNSHIPTLIGNKKCGNEIIIIIIIIIIMQFLDSGINFDAHVILHVLRSK